MASTKRKTSGFEFNPYNNDTTEQKRFFTGFSGEEQRTEPSQLTARLPLDTHRAESSRQHVRALNTQFASWIQTQLEKHPDELWEDGVEDYLNHAKTIMEKFSDVVSWLKANAAKGSIIGSDTSPQKIGSHSTEKGNGMSFGKPVTPPASTTASFVASWVPGALFNSNAGSESMEKDKGESFGKPVTPPVSTTANFAPPRFPGALFNSNSGLGSMGKDDGVSKPVTPPASTTANTAALWSPKALFNSNAGSDSLEKENGLSLGKPVTPAASTTANTAAPSIFNSSTPFTFGLQSSLGNSNAPATFGLQSSLVGNQIQNSDSLNVGGSNDLNGEESAEQPSSPSVKKAEEKGIKVVHEVRCKLFVKSSDPNAEDQWKNKGTGQLSIKCNEDGEKGTKESKPTIVVRNDVGKLLLNASIYPGIKTTIQKNSILAIFHTTGDGDDETVKARMFSIRTRSEEERDKLAEVIKEYSPAA